MKAFLNPIALKPAESFTCVEWKVPDHDNPAPSTFSFQLEYLLVAVDKSRGTAYVGDHVRPFRDGDIFLFGPKLPLSWTHHAMKTQPVRHIITATFDENFSRHAFQPPEAEPIRQMLAQSKRGILFPHRVSARIMPALLRVTQLKGWARMLLFFDVLGHLASTRDMQLLASPGFSSEIDEQELDRLSKVCRFVHASYAREIREKDAAALIGLSPAPFSRFFRRRMAKTFVSYVTEVRLSEACRLLLETDLTIVQIAFEAGFNNLSNFNRHFQNLRGMTPREYRNHTRKGATGVGLSPVPR